MGGEDVITGAVQDSEWESGTEVLVITVVYLVFGLLLALGPFLGPSTTARGFTSDAVPTINDRGDIDCGGSSLRVVLRGPRVAIPPGDLARRAEKACRDHAVESVWFGGVGGLALVVICGSSLVRRARRYRARRRATGAGDSYDSEVPVCPLDSAALASPSGIPERVVSCQGA